MLKSFLTALRELLWSLIAVLAALALFAVVLVPSEFAGRMGSIFDALSREGFDIKIKTPVGEATFERVKERQLAHNDALILDLRDQLADARAQLADLAAPIEENFQMPGPPGSGAGLWRPRPSLQGPAARPEPGAVPAEAAGDDPPRWVVIAGTGRDIAGQLDTLEALRRSEFGEAVILRTGEWYQSALVYAGRTRAQEALDLVAGLVGGPEGVYMRALDVACPDSRPVAGNADLLACG